MLKTCVYSLYEATLRKGVCLEYSPVAKWFECSLLGEITIFGTYQL